LRIKDAASIVLVDRRDPASPRLLMGRRSAKHQFMPNVYVFPGGRVDYGDRYAPFGEDYDAATLDLLLQEMKVRPTPLRARMLGLAAIRETFEEVGLMIGAKSPAIAGHRHPGWGKFGEAGLIPDLSRLTYIARAITPPGNNRRFDTRFFMADVDRELERQTACSSRELEDVQWVAFDALEDIPTHFITRRILLAAKAALQNPEYGKAALAIPFYRAKPKAGGVVKVITYLRPGKPPMDGGELILTKT